MVAVDTFPRPVKYMLARPSGFEPEASRTATERSIRAELRARCKMKMYGSWTDIGHQCNCFLDCKIRVLYIASLYGAVAQLGARLNGIQKVRGSIPLSSTIL